MKRARSADIPVALKGGNPYHGMMDSRAISRESGVQPMRPDKALALILIIGLLSIPVMSSALQDVQDLSFIEQPFPPELIKSTPTFGVVFTDINGDERDDLIISNHGWLRPSIYLNTGGGFQDASFLLRLDREVMDRHGITVVDIDNDGDRDLFIAAGGADGVGPGGTNHVFLNRLSESGSFYFEDFTDRTDIAFKSMRSRSFIPLPGKSGRLIDLYLTAKIRPATTNIYFRNESSPTGLRLIPDPTRELNQSVSSEGRDIFFDMDRDGDPDLIALLSERACFYRNENGRFVLEQSRLHAYDPVTCAAVGDLNNDGYPDAVLGLRAYSSFSDNLSWSDREVHLVFNRANPDPGVERLDVDGLDIRTDAMEAVIDFWDKPGILSDDPSHFYIGKNKINPASLWATISADQAEGPPILDKQGTYIWYSSDNRTWHLRCKLGDSISSIRGKLNFSKNINVESIWVESFAHSRTSDRIFINRSGKDFMLQANTPNLEHEQDTRSLVVYDFNNDGWQDIIGIRGNEAGDTNGNPFILINDESTGFKLQESDPFASGEDDIYQSDKLVVGFLDDDGRPDLFMTNGFGRMPGSRGPYKLFKNTSLNTNHYILLELSGVTSNRDAIGAQVELYSSGDTLLGYRELGAGYNIQQSTHRLHFGIGKYSGKVTARIRWPNGGVSVREVPRDRLYRIREK